jgi:hypothetical protein
LNLSIPAVPNTPTTQPARGAGLSPFDRIALAMARPANDDALLKSIAGAATPPAALLDAIAAAANTPVLTRPTPVDGDSTPVTASALQPDTAENPSLYQLFLEARIAIRASAPPAVPPALAPLIAAAPPAPETRAVSEIVAEIAAALAAAASARRDPALASTDDRFAGQVSPIRAVSRASAAGDRHA